MQPFFMNGGEATMIPLYLNTQFLSLILSLFILRFQEVWFDASLFCIFLEDVTSELSHPNGQLIAVDGHRDRLLPFLIIGVVIESRTN